MKANSKRASRGSQRTSRKKSQVATKKENKSQSATAADVRSPGNVSRAIEAVRRGESQQFATIFDFLHSRLRHYVTALQNGSRSATHSVSDTLSTTWQELFEAITAPSKNSNSEVRDRNQLSGLALKIAERKSVDGIRRLTAKRRGGGAKTTVLPETLIANNKEPLEWLIAQEMASEVQRLIAKVKKDFDRRLIQWSLVEGCSHAEIRDRLEIPLRSKSDVALKRRIQRANRSILDALKEKFPEE